jgi:hypothetical protein
MKKIAIIFAFLLAGCATTPKTVYVPTPVKCPTPNIPIEPYYPIYDLSELDKNQPGKVLKSYAMSLKMCMGQNKIMRKQLEGYNHN